MHAPNGWTMKVAALVVASVVASGVALYALLQSPRLSVPATQATASPPAATGERPLDQMAERLAARLSKDGGSAGDWALLGRSYREMARWAEAVAAFEKSLALAPGDAQVQSDLEAARAKATPGQK